MNRLPLSQKVFLYAKARMRGVTEICICTPFFLATACSDNQVADKAHATKDDSAQIASQPEQIGLKPLTPLYTPNRAVGQGQLNALENYMSKRWQVNRINDTPPAHPVTIDLTTFGSGDGQAITDCGTIYFKLDTAAVLSGGLSIVNIERQLSDCPHTTEDDVMRILGDLYGFTHQDDTLTLLSLKDEITLTPATTQ